MKRLLLMGTVPFVFQSVIADDNLNATWFGLEFEDAQDNVRISWVDPSYRPAQKLQSNDVLLSVEGVPFADAEALTTTLRNHPAGKRLRFEVIGLKDAKPRRVAVLGRPLRDCVAERFRKERDRELREVLHIPKLPASRLRIAVIESFDATKRGLRLRYYPKDSSARPERELGFWGLRTSPSGSSTIRLATEPAEFHYSNLTPEQVQKLPTLNRSQLASVRARAYVELGPDRTDELLRVLQQSETLRRNIGYSPSSAIVYNRYLLTDDEVRNMTSCLLYLQVLTQASGEPQASEE